MSNKNNAITKELLKPILILGFIYAVAIIPLLRANIDYADDMARAFYGYSGWEDYGRYISNFFSHIIHADSFLADVSPLPQLFACVVLGISGVMLKYVITESREVRIIDYVALIPLGLSPYFLQCLSFKYDAPYMAISILASVLPLLFRNKKWCWYLLSVLGGHLIVCMTYQAATGIFPMLVIVLAARELANEKSPLRFVITSVIGYVAALGFFALFIMKPVDGYVTNTLPPVNRILGDSILHLRTYYHYVRTDFKKEWIIFIVIMAIGYICVEIKRFRNKMCGILISGIALVGMLIMAFGMYPVLSEPLYAPRGMYGFGVFLAVLAVVIASSENNLKGAVIYKSAIVLLSWGLFTFSFVYGNVINVQKEYIEFREEHIVDKLISMPINEFTPNDEKISLQIKGSIGYVPSINNMPEDFLLIKRLIPVTLEGNHWYSTFQIIHKYGIKNFIWDDNELVDEEVLPIMYDDDLQTIRGNSNRILIELK